MSQQPGAWQSKHPPESRANTRIPGTSRPAADLPRKVAHKAPRAGNQKTPNSSGQVRTK